MSEKAFSIVITTNNVKSLILNFDKRQVQSITFCFNKSNVIKTAMRWLGFVFLLSYFGGSKNNRICYGIAVRKICEEW